MVIITSVPVMDNGGKAFKCPQVLEHAQEDILRNVIPHPIQPFTVRWEQLVYRH